MPGHAWALWCVCFVPSESSVVWFLAEAPLWLVKACLCIC